MKQTLLGLSPRSEPMRALASHVAAVDWSKPAKAADLTLQAIRAVAIDECVRSEVSAWAAEGLGTPRELACHETGTHRKWFVAYAGTNEVVVWLHEYKPDSERRDTHAQTIHNHRYWFVSAVVYGGYDHVHYMVSNGEPFETGREVYVAPASYVMSPHEVHSVENLRDPTLTLIVQGPAVRRVSQVFEAGSVVGVREFPDFAGRAQQLANSVRRAISDSQTG